MTQTERPGEDFHLQRSSRDPVESARRLAEWLAGELPEGAEPEVVLAAVSEANGMSSETVPAQVSWTENGARVSGSFVIRIAPSADDVPVFASYDMAHQYDAIRLVGELSDVPVPTPRWLDASGDVLGSPFFFMDRVEGMVPPDVLPYTFGDNWFFDADPADRLRLQQSTVAAIAGLHQIPDGVAKFGFLDPEVAGATPLRRQLRRTSEWYEWATGPFGRSELVDRALGWLSANWPDADRTGNDVLSWGDSRIGNVLYRDFEPVAVLDWEMAGIGPRELDLGWLVFAHRVFQSLAETFELPGLPDVLTEADVCVQYQRLTGVEVGELTWFCLYAAVIWGVVFMRTGARQLRFGEIERPAEADALFHHAALFRSLLEEVSA